MRVVIYRTVGWGQRGVIVVTVGNHDDVHTLSRTAAE